MRIHISETTHADLLKAGIYHMVKRGEVMAKVSSRFVTDQHVTNYTHSSHCGILL